MLSTCIRSHKAEAGLKTHTNSAQRAPEKGDAVHEEHPQLDRHEAVVDEAGEGPQLRRQTVGSWGNTPTP